MAFNSNYNSYYKRKDFDFTYKNIAFFNDELPQIILSEDEGKYYIRALIAGLGSDDFNLNFKENQLELEVSFSSPSGKYLLQERRVGTFRRVINFHNCIDTANIISNFNNGLLYIELAKNKEEEIAIESEELERNTDTKIIIEAENEKK